jgi:hypothetical protein
MECGGWRVSEGDVVGSHKSWISQFERFQNLLTRHNLFFDFTINFSTRRSVLGTYGEITVTFLEGKSVVESSRDREPAERGHHARTHAKKSDGLTDVSIDKAACRCRHRRMSTPPTPAGERSRQHE